MVVTYFQGAKATMKIEIPLWYNRSGLFVPDKQKVMSFSKDSSSLGEHPPVRQAAGDHPFRAD
jgi:hypothetical protein